MQVFRTEYTLHEHVVCTKLQGVWVRVREQLRSEPFARRWRDDLNAELVDGAQ